MTVIVGLKTNKWAEKAVVIGADRLHAAGEVNSAAYLRHLEQDSTSLRELLNFMKDQGFGFGKVKFSMDSKIKVSDGRVLAHTGTKDKSNERVSDLLLETNKFLQNDSFLREMLFPFELPVPIDSLDLYKKTFDLDKKIAEAYVPEIRRIFDIGLVGKHVYDFGPNRLVYYDSSYNFDLSQHIFSLRYKGNKMAPVLLEVCPTGRLIGVQNYCAKGCGGETALEFLREALGTEHSKYSGETSVNRKVSTNDAVDIVKSAIEYTNERNPFCKGLDYVILTKDGLETHFSDENATFELGIFELVDRRIKALKEETAFLEKVSSA